MCSGNPAATGLDFSAAKEWKKKMDAQDRANEKTTMRIWGNILNHPAIRPT